MKKNSDIKKEITRHYTKFFKRKEFKVDSKSGILKNGILRKGKKLKFATYPYIGNQYGKNIKILFIGLDIGEDVHIGIIDFKKRQEDIGNDENYYNYNNKKKTYNPHIAGTSITAAFFSNGNKVKDKIKKEKNYKDAIRVLRNDKMNNPLAYVALTNFYKFVTKERKGLSGSSDRKHVSREHECNLLLDEIGSLKPDIIIFQSVEFWNKYKDNKYEDFFNKLKIQNKKVKIYIGPHPTCRPPYYSRIPKKYLSYFELIDKIK